MSGFGAPVCCVPIALAVVAVMAEDLKVFDIQRKAWPQFSWLYMVNIHHGPIGWGRAATHTFWAIFFEGFHANLSPLKSC